jgi:prevent-host-death family protein
VPESKTEKLSVAQIMTAGQSMVGTDRGYVEISARQARDNFASVIARARFQGKRTIITEHGIPAAVMISLEDDTMLRSFGEESGTVDDFIPRRGEPKNAERKGRQPAIPKVHMASPRKNEPRP